MQPTHPPTAGANFGRARLRLRCWKGTIFELIEPNEVTPELESSFYTGGAGGSNVAIGLAPRGLVARRKDARC